MTMIHSPIKLFRFLWMTLVYCLLLPPTVAAQTRLPRQEKGKSLFSYVSLHRLPKANLWSVSPDTDLVALANWDTNDAEIQIISLNSSHAVAAKMEMKGVGQVYALAWAKSGNQLVVCGDSVVLLLEFNKKRHSLSVVRRVAAKWNSVCFASDGKALFGRARNARNIFLYTLALTAPKTQPVEVKDCPVSQLSNNTPFLQLTGGRVLLVGAGQALGAEGHCTSAVRIGNAGLYDLVTGPDSFAGKLFSLWVRQPVAPKGKYDIMLVTETLLNAVALEGGPQISVPWRKSDRIEAIQCSSNHRVFVQLYRNNSSENLILYKYRIKLLPK